MSDSKKSSLLARLAGSAATDETAWDQVKAAAPQSPLPSPANDADSELNALLSRVQQLVDTPATAPPPDTPPAARPAAPPAAPPHREPLSAGLDAQRQDLPPGPAAVDDPEVATAFMPIEPNSFTAAGLSDSDVEALLLKYLVARGEGTGRDIADQVRMPFRLIDPLLASMKNDRLVAHKGAAMMNDYVYQLTDLGRERGRKLAEQCSYFGAAPVSLDDYIFSVGEQSLTRQHPNQDDLKRAFSDLLINQKMLLRLGPAVNSGRGLFLFGAPGNGKTSIAERVTAAFGETIWIPRALGIDGEIMRLFDPAVHDEVPLESDGGLLDKRKIDKRWVRVKRPTIIVGGELTMDQLEVSQSKDNAASEAPVQMKSNCGTLVIDDFGRQRMTTDELLNRWIVPLEKRYDFLNIAGGKKIQVPFDQLIIFSTNLEPKDLVDDAFLRRIPYKIEVEDPSEREFRELFKIMAPIIGVQWDQDGLDYLVATHYRAIKRPFRCCQPRDLLSQIRNYCKYVGHESRMSRENFDFAVENYFAVM